MHKTFAYILIKCTYLFSRMTGALWASQDQTEFLWTFISDYYKINKGDKNYVPFWTRLREKWFELYPEQRSLLSPTYSARSPSGVRAVRGQSED
jgi:hypothetical protein